MPGLTGVADLFPGTGGVCYLNTAAEGLAPAGLAAALARYAEAKSAGSAGRPAMLDVERRCREGIAQLLRVDPSAIAFRSSYSHALNAVVASIDWAPRDAVVISELEFPTTELAAARLAERGVEVRVAPSAGGRVEADAFAARLDERARLAVVSLVSFKTGGAVDLPAISRATRTAGVPLFLDATQGLGLLPFDCALADFVAASCFKWLLGAHGAAVLYVNPETAGGLRPAHVGWRSVPDLFARPHRLPLDLHADARRFEDGMPPFLALYALECGLDILSGFPPDALAAHARALGGRLLDGLARLGWPALTPRAPEARAGIVAVSDEAFEKHARVLAGRGIVVWGREGRLRASLHLYNAAADVDRLLDALSALEPPAARRRSA